MSELVDRATRTTARSTRGEKRLVIVRVPGVTSPFDPPSDDRIEQVLGRRADPLDFCVTLVSGCTPDEVRRAFDGVPAPRHSGGSLVSVLSLAGGVVVVEDGGGTGTGAAVLRAASRWGRAASYHCSAAGLEVLGFAEFGRLLDAGPCRLPDERPAHPRLAALVDEVVAATDDPLLLPVLVLERFVGMVVDEGPDLTELRHRD